MAVKYHSKAVIQYYKGEKMKGKSDVVITIVIGSVMVLVYFGFLDWVIPYFKY